MKKFLIAAAVVVCITAFAESAEACSCMNLPIQAHFQNSAAIFVGEIVGTKHNANQSLVGGRLIVGPGTIEATFKVTRAVQGTMKVGDTVTIRTNDQGPACGLVTLGAQAPGTSWVIYAHQAPGSSLTTGSCSRTRLASAAAEDLAYFDSLNQVR